MAKATFPTTDSENNTYFNTAVPYLNTHKVRLGVSPTNIGILNPMFLGVSGWQPTWTEFADDTTRTDLTQDNKDDLLESITEHLRIIYDDIPFSVLTNQDKLKLKIFDDDDTRTRRSKIDSVPHANMNNTGGSEIRFTCRVDPDESRASLHRDADFVEMKWALLDLDAPAPNTLVDLPNIHQSTRAAFKVAFGHDNIGKKLYAAFRWAITGSPERAGEWTAINNFVIGN